MRNIRRTHDKTPATWILIPGGPGLQPEYMGPWARAAARALGSNVKAIDYSLFAGLGAGHPKDRLRLSLRRLATRIRQLAPRGMVVLVGHSFGARIIIELLRSSPQIASAAVLINCPSGFAPSRDFSRRKRRIRLPPTIDNESDFRRYWRSVLPLYFSVCPKREWIAGLARGTNWIETAWLGAAITGEPKVIRKSGATPLLFVHCSKDKRFPSSNARRLRSVFRAARHAVIVGTGHFPMMENQRALTAETISFLNAQRPMEQRRF